MGEEAQMMLSISRLRVEILSLKVSTTIHRPMTREDSDIWCVRLIRTQRNGKPYYHSALFGTSVYKQAHALDYACALSRVADQPPSDELKARREQKRIPVPST
jgi:hypothetical protein